MNRWRDLTEDRAISSPSSDNAINRELQQIMTSGNARRSMEKGD
jgi:hypothetical protein